MRGRRPPLSETPLSAFVRAPAEIKGAIYSRVMARAIYEQAKTLDLAEMAEVFAHAPDSVEASGNLLDANSS
jgi:hypothetical protein